MWPYLVICDLREPERYGQALNSILVDFGATPVMRQSWLIHSDLNARALLEQFRPVVGESDSLLVFELAEDRAFMNSWEKCQLPAIPPRRTHSHEGRIPER
jgi:hypothetical protein